MRKKNIFPSALVPGINNDQSQNRLLTYAGDIAMVDKNNLICESYS